MNVFTVSFFGHRRLSDSLTTEKELQKTIRDLVRTKEYVEFLVGRDGEFDQLVSSTVRRCKREIRDDNSSLVLVLPYETAEPTFERAFRTPSSHRRLLRPFQEWRKPLR